jgi:hypothetical protein
MDRLRKIVQLKRIVYGLEKAQRRGLAPPSPAQHGIRTCGALLRDGRSRCERLQVGSGQLARCYDHQQLTERDADKWGCHGGPNLSIIDLGSPIGRGVIARTRFRPLDIITKLEIADVDTADLEIVRSFNGYLLKLPGLPLLAGVKEPFKGCGLGSFINSPRHRGLKANTKFCKRNGAVYVQATVNIAPGQELLINYGQSFRVPTM